MAEQLHAVEEVSSSMSTSTLAPMHITVHPKGLSYYRFFNHVLNRFNVRSSAAAGPTQNSPCKGEVDIATHSASEAEPAQSMP